MILNIIRRAETETTTGAGEAETRDTEAAGGTTETEGGKTGGGGEEAGKERGGGEGETQKKQEADRQSQVETQARECGTEAYLNFDPSDILLTS